MNTRIRILVSSAAIGVSAASAATIGQTFESGEDTSAWGSSGWSNANYASGPGFLDPSIGGSFAGSGSSSVGQESSREFKNNTVGLDEQTQAYTVSFYLRITPGEDTPDSGNFAIVDGDYGAHAAGVRVNYTGGVATWQASNNGSWSDTFTSVSFTAGDIYRVSFAVDPVANTSAVTLAHVTSIGGILAQQTLGNLPVSGNVFTNNQNGKLLVHLEGSAGVTNAQLDNILISAIPEPSAAALLGAFAALGVVSTRRRACIA